MHRDGLFTGAVELPIAEGPLGREVVHSPLEGYVLDELPADLRAVSEETMAYKELAAKQQPLLKEAWDGIMSNSDPDVAKLTQLDLLFMAGGYIPAGQNMYATAPGELLSAIHLQADYFPQLNSFMTYELLVDVNSEQYEHTGQMRIYADGIDGLHERDFYLAHHQAEPHIRKAAEELHALAEDPECGDRLALLESAWAETDEFKRYMGIFSKLPKDSFRYFRKYLESYPDGTRNASGAFMPSVQLLELSLHSPTEMYGVYLDESMPFFSRWAQPLIHDWRIASEAGVNLEDRLNSGALVLDGAERIALDSVIEEFTRFRQTHLAVTRRQIPEAFSSVNDLSAKAIATLTGEQQIMDPEVTGTGGFDVRNVLVNSVWRLMQLQARLRG